MGWLKRAAGEVVVFALGLVVAAALSAVLVPVDFPAGVLDVEETRRLYNRRALRMMISLPVWIASYYVLHNLYCRWRTRRAQ